MNIAFPLQQLLQRRPSVLRVTYVVLLVILLINYIIFTQILRLKVYQYPFLV